MAESGPPQSGTGVPMSPVIGPQTVSPSKRVLVSTLTVAASAAAPLQRAWTAKCDGAGSSSTAQPCGLHGMDVAGAAGADPPAPVAGPPGGVGSGVEGTCVLKALSGASGRST